MSETLPTPESKRPDTERYFDKFSEYYDDEIAAQAIAPKFDGLIDKTFEHIEAGSIQSALDLGAGTGNITAAILRRTTPERMVVVDLSNRMLDFLRQKHDLPAQDVVHADARTYIANSQHMFDLITSVGVLEFLPDAPGAIRDAAAHLNTNGVLAVSYVPRAEAEPHETLNDDSESVIESSAMEYSWYPAEIEQAFTDGGLAIVDRVEGLLVQEEDESTNTAQRVYNFVVGVKHDSAS